MRITEDEEQLKQQIDMVSRRLVWIAVVLIVGVIGAQLLLQNDMLRHLLTAVDRWEGTAYR
jgi:magnesium-transporting ATPase (P-type)